MDVNMEKKHRMDLKVGSATAAKQYLCKTYSQLWLDMAADAALFSAILTWNKDQRLQRYYVFMCVTFSYVTQFLRDAVIQQLGIN